MNWILAALIFLPSAFAQNRTISKPQDKSGSVYCSDIEEVVKEAIEYHLTGAPTTSLPLTCALKMKWRFFKPTLEERSPEPDNKIPSEYIWFNPKKDSYKIISTEKTKDRYQVKVKFKIAGKEVETNYTYEPWDIWQKKNGVCGFITNDKGPWVFRKDCQK